MTAVTPKPKDWQYPRTKLWSRKRRGYVWVTRYTGEARQVWRFENLGALAAFIFRSTRMYRTPFQFISGDDPLVLAAVKADTWIDADWCAYAHSDKKKAWPFTVPVAIARKRNALVF